MANKKCIIIHGCPSNAEKAMDPETRTYDKHWIPSTKTELEKQGIITETPTMPEPWQPDYEKFKEEFEKLEVDENTILVGHSCGCAFLVRWLGESKKKIHKLVLVAPWKTFDRHGIKNKYKEKFYAYDIDRTIKERVDEVFMFTANDEEEGGKVSLKIFHDALGGEIINLDGHGHYTMGDMGKEELPELVEVIVS
ncbi:hypothetical protein C0583_04525 [Candidatus Parcubacteria bacterium]|nr:MAG: hypothetical protein C0583_04525 [Candidatus Parcubacteria bacterium]